MAMYSRYLLVVNALFFITFHSYAQSGGNSENSVVMGKSLDQSQSEVMYASVALLSSDSSVLDGVITDVNGD